MSRRHKPGFSSHVATPETHVDSEQPHSIPPFDHTSEEGSSTSNAAGAEPQADTAQFKASEDRAAEAVSRLSSLKSDIAAEVSRKLDGVDAEDLLSRLQAMGMKKPMRTIFLGAGFGTLIGWTLSNKTAMSFIQKAIEFARAQANSANVKNASPKGFAASKSSESQVVLH